MKSEVAIFLPTGIICCACVEDSERSAAASRPAAERAMRGDIMVKTQSNQAGVAERRVKTLSRVVLDHKRLERHASPLLSDGVGS